MSLDHRLLANAGAIQFGSPRRRSFTLINWLIRRLRKQRSLSR